MKMRLHLFDKDKHFGWFCEKVPTVWSDSTGGYVIVDEDTDTPQAAILFHRWTNSTCTVAVVIDNPIALRHNLLETAFRLAFIEGARIKVIIEISSKNEKSLVCSKNVGFEEIFRIEDGYDVGDDLVILEMKKENCRFINKEEFKEVA